MSSARLFLRGITGLLLFGLALLWSPAGVWADPPPASGNPAGTGQLNPDSNDWGDSLSGSGAGPSDLPPELRAESLPPGAQAKLKEWLAPMGEMWRDFKSDVRKISNKKYVKPLIHIPKSMIHVYMAIGTIQAYHATHSNDPTVFSAWMEGMKDLNGHIGFVMFSAAAGLTTNGLNAALGQTPSVVDQARQLDVLSRQKPGMLRTAGTVSRQIAISQIGMAAGMLVNDVYSQVANHPDILAMRKAMSMRDLNAVERQDLIWMHVNRFVHKVTDGARWAHWWDQQIPHLESLITSGVLSTVGQMGLRLAAARVGVAALRVTAWAKRTHEVSSVARGVLLGLRIAKTASTVLSLTPAGWLIKLGLWVGEGLAFFAVDELLKDGFQDEHNEDRAIETLRRREGHLALKMAAARAAPSDQNLHEVHRAVMELERAWDGYRNIFMRKAQELYQRHAMFLADFDKQLGRIANYYRWFVKGAAEADPSWQLPSGLLNKDGQWRPQGRVTDSAVAEDIEEMWVAYVCGPTPDKATSRAEYFFDHIAKPWSMRDTFAPFRAYEGPILDRALCRFASEGLEHPLYPRNDPELRSRSVPYLSAHSQTDIPKFRELLNAKRLESLRVAAADPAQAVRLRQALDQALAKAQVTATPIRDEFLRRYYRLVQRAIAQPMTGRTPEYANGEDRILGFRGEISYRGESASLEVYQFGDPITKTYLRWELESLANRMEDITHEVKEIEGSQTGRLIADQISELRSKLDAVDPVDADEALLEDLRARHQEALVAEREWRKESWAKYEEYAHLWREYRLVRTLLEEVSREPEVSVTARIPFPLKRGGREGCTDIDERIGLGQSGGWIPQEVAARAETMATKTLVRELVELQQKCPLKTPGSEAYASDEVRACWKQLDKRKADLKCMTSLTRRVYPRGILPAYDMEIGFWSRLMEAESQDSVVARFLDETLMRLSLKRSVAQTLLNFAVHPDPDFQAVPAPHLPASQKFWDLPEGASVVQAWDQYFLR